MLWVDLATTLAAADIYGLSAEANPIMRWLLNQGLGVALFAHLVIFAIAIAGFSVIVRIGRSLEGHRARQYRLWCLTWLVGMILIGLAVSLNNFVLVLAATLG